MADETGRSYDPGKDAQAQEPLTANEVKLVTRLFGDPFAFPLEFKAWLRGWLEEQYPRLGALGTPAETGAAGAFVPPAGAILDYGGDVAPNGYVLCDGAEYDKTSLVYQRLFAAIGTKYGSSGGNMFNVPDFRGRMSVGRGSHADVDTMGDNDGAALGSRSPKHRHSVNDPQHSHGVDATATGALHGPPNGNLVVQDGSLPYNAIEVHGGTVGSSYTGISVGPGGSPLDTPAYLVVNKIISLGA